MNKECSIVQDILPLYVDEVCSEESRIFVETHISDCNDCNEVLKKLRTTEYVDDLRNEGNAVLEMHAKKETRKSAIVGMIFSAIYMIPIIICMIVNIATGHGLSWFFIVLASLMVLASITVVPMMVYKNKLLYTMWSFTGTVILLLATICIYSRGNWFFLAATSVLFGLSMVFVPVSVFRVNNKFVKNNKLLTVVVVNTVLLLVMMFTIGIFVKHVAYWTISRAILIVVLSYIAMLVVIIRYIKANGFTRTGLACILTGLYMGMAANLTFMLMGYSVVWHAFHPFIWNTSTYNGNMHWVELFTATVIGIIFLIIGKNKVNKKNEQIGEIEDEKN